MERGARGRMCGVLFVYATICVKRSNNLCLFMQQFTSTTTIHVRAPEEAHTTPLGCARPMQEDTVILSFALGPGLTLPLVAHANSRLPQGLTMALTGPGLITVVHPVIVCA